MKAPKLLVCECTNRCNGNCVMCAARFGEREPRDLDISIYRKVIDALPSVVWVHPQDFGEPLMYPHIVDAVRYAKSRGKRVVIYTNGSLMDGFAAAGLLEAGLDRVVFSADASGRETYEKLRPPLSWKRFVENVERFQSFRDEGGYATETVARYTICPENRAQVPEIRAFWASRVDRVMGVEEVDVPKPEVTGFCSGMPVRCRKPWTQFVVKSNGDVSLCCRDWWGKYPVGNVYDDDPAEVWASERFNELRVGMQTGEHYPAICDYCRRKPERI